MSNSLVIRADAGLQMGTGHVMRCLALAEPWRRSGSDVTLVSAELPSALRERAESAGIKIHPLQDVPGSSADTNSLVQLAQKTNAVVIVDGYHFNAEYQRALKEAGLRVLFFDDFGHAKNYTADFVLNQNLGASSALYENRAAHTQLLLGPRFVQLRGEFSSWREWQRIIPTSAKKILVTLGGSDPDNATLKVLQALSALPDFETTIVIGGSNPHKKTLIEVAKNFRHIRFLENVANMPELMSQHDLAIAAGGSTAWELAFMGLPALILVLAENQRSNAAQLQAAGIARSVTLENIGEAISDLSDDAETRATMSDAGRKLIDGRGSFRVWLYFHENKLRLRPATENDARLLWNWTNDPAVREVSFSSQPIPWNDHLLWLQAKLRDASCFLWLAEDEQGHAIGMVRFDLREGGATISVSLDGAQRGKNLGALLLWTACRKLFRETKVETITAFIKPGNLASIRAFAKAGLEPGSATVVKSQPALRFQIQRGQLQP